MIAFALINQAYAADLIEVYKQALVCDPIFQQAIYQRLATKEGLPISISALLPQVNLNLNPFVTRTGYSGSFIKSIDGGFISPRNNTMRAYYMTLTVTQTIFNFAQFASVAGAYATSKGADATLNAALQDLMVRTSTAYFAILRDEENLSYTKASKLAYKEQLDQVKQEYNVGIKTITDVYTAQASYDSAVASVIAAETTLANDRENLRVITGRTYTHLKALSEHFPLISPRPRNINQWVHIALIQNWNIKASRYAVVTACHNVKQQLAGHLPTVSVEGTLSRYYENNINGYPSFNDSEGPGTQTNRQLALNVNVPIFSGGSVTALTNQAVYNYKLTQQQLEQTIRDTLNTTRQSYLGVVSGISQIKADKQTIKSTISSLEGMEVSYQVGTETLVNVLNQQQKVYEAQTQYATDRYNYVNNLIALKEAAGTLSFCDLRSINAWLSYKKPTVFKKYRKRTLSSAKKIMSDLIGK